MYTYICIYIEGLPPHIFSNLAIYNWNRICNTTEILSQHQSSSSLLTCLIFCLSTLFLFLCDKTTSNNQLPHLLRHGHDNRGGSTVMQHSETIRAIMNPKQELLPHLCIDSNFSCGTLIIMHTLLCFSFSFFSFFFLKWHLMDIYFVCVFLVPGQPPFNLFNMNTSKMLVSTQPTSLHSLYLDSSFSLAGFH